MVKVTRKTRVSFEKPADDIVMDELFGGDESDGFEEASDLFVKSASDLVARVVLPSVDSELAQPSSCQDLQGIGASDPLDTW